MASKGNPQVSRAPAPVPVTPLAHLLAVAVTALVLVWLLHFREGLAFRSHIKQKIFNIHPLLTILGFVLIGGEAIMAYKTVPAAQRVQKQVHLLLHLVALMAGIIGTYTAFKFHDELGILHVYTLHSWLGIITLCLYGLQWLYSFFIFVFPQSKSTTRATVAPWHIFGGITIFLLAIFSAITGLVEKFTFLKLQHSQEALIINFTGLMIILFSIAVGLVMVPRM